MRSLLVSAVVLCCAAASLRAGLAPSYQFVDLTPPGYLSGLVLGAHGNEQVGEAQTTTSSSHALLWHGSASSVVDLHPASGIFASSTAIATNGSRQVGSGFLPGPQNVPHALMWTGSAASVVDLNPPGWVGSGLGGI